MSWTELLTVAEGIRRDAAAQVPRVEGLRVVGIGWATVDADRAFDELGSILDGPSEWRPEEREAWLGARAWRREPAPDGGGVALRVLEPDTEGPLAAHLARFGEGVGAVYVAGGGEADRVVPVDRRWGPFVVVRSRAG